MTAQTLRFSYGARDREIGMATAHAAYVTAAAPRPRAPQHSAHTPEQRRAWKDRADDEVLVARFQSGDTAAFSLLVQKYQDKLMRVVSRLVHNRPDAEDVVQETFIRAYRALPQFRGESGFYTWLFTIGMNAAKNFRITQVRKFDVWLQSGADPDDPSYEGPVSVDMNSPMAELETKQLIAALNSVLDAMPEHLSIPLILCQIEGMSYEDIATTMQCPTGTVRSRIFRARELIATKLAPLVDARSLLRKGKE